VWYGCGGSGISVAVSSATIADTDLLRLNELISYMHQCSDLPICS
jgi:hypothetical protein